MEFQTNHGQVHALLEETILQKGDKLDEKVLYLSDKCNTTSVSLETQKCLGGLAI